MSIMEAVTRFALTQWDPSLVAVEVATHWMVMGEHVMVCTYTCTCIYTVEETT